MNYLIVDNTTNTGARYIGEDDRNCKLEENAMIFKNEIKAGEYINKNMWNEWAVAEETDYPVNM